MDEVLKKKLAEYKERKRQMNAEKIKAQEEEDKRKAEEAKVIDAKTPEFDEELLENTDFSEEEINDLEEASDEEGDIEELKEMTPAPAQTPVQLQQPKSDEDIKRAVHDEVMALAMNEGLFRHLLLASLNQISENLEKLVNKK